MTVVNFFLGKPRDFMVLSALLPLSLWEAMALKDSGITPSQFTADAAKDRKK
jgi:hypothetical protein